jgi:hypothetical protein
VSLVALYVVLFLGIRGFSTPAWGFVVGWVALVLFVAFSWTQGHGCAYEDSRGRIVKTDCGTPPPR